MDTEPTQFTLEGNEVVHIANMDTNAAAEAEAHAAAAAAAAQAASAVQQVEVMHGEEHHQQHLHHHHQEHQHLEQQHLEQQQQHQHHQLQHHQQHHLQSVSVGMEVDGSHVAHAHHTHDHPHAYTGDMATPALPPMPTMETNPDIDHITPTDLPAWTSYFFQLQVHQTTYGTLDVDPQTNPSLFSWVDEQRELYKLWQDGEKEALSQDRMLLLDALGFDWEGSQEPNYGAQAEAAAAAANSNLSGSTQDVETFHLRLSQLEQYKTSNGHPNVPETYKEDPTLGRWVAQQRAAYRKQTLPQDRIDAMTDIGFDFTPGDKKVPFETRLNQLKAYKDINGNVKVPRRYTENPGLGEWLHCQKKLYRRWENDQKGGMNETRRKLLLDVGVDFSIELSKSEAEIESNMVDAKHPSIDAASSDAQDEELSNRSTKWDDKFHELREYKLANGHTNVPRRSKRNPANDALGEWVHFQRRQYRNLLNGKNSTLTIARKKALELLEFQWSRTNGNSLHHHHGHHHEGSQVKTMTVRDAVQVQILKAHEEGKTAPWEDRFAQLTEYVQRFGNADVPINYAENLSLGSWVYRLRTAYKVWNEEDGQNTKAEGEVTVPSEHIMKEDEQGSVTKEKSIDGFVGDTNAIKEDVTMETNTNPNTGLPDTEEQVEAPNPTAEIEIPDVGDQVFDGEIQVPDTRVHVEAPQTVVETIYADPSMEAKPYIADVDRMTQERYDKLVAVGFDFAIKKIPDDFVTGDDQEPATLILSKTAEEEEKPTVEDEQDVLEITLGEEEASPNVNITPKQDMEINEMEVSAILDENPVVPSLDSPMAIPVVKHNPHEQQQETEIDDMVSPIATTTEDEKNLVTEEVKQEQADSTPVQKLDDLTATPSHDLLVIDPMSTQKMEDINSPPAHSVEDPNLVPTQEVNDINSPPVPNIEDPTSEPIQKVDDVDPTPEHEIENIDTYPAPVEEQTNVNNTETNVVNTTPTILANDQGTDTKADTISERPEGSPNPKRRKLSATVKVEWEERVLELIQYKIRKGNCNIPVKWKPNTGLADWVWRQRDQYREYRNGQPSTLTTTRIAKLTELGFEFIAHDHHGNPIYHDPDSQLYSVANTEKARLRKGRASVAKQRTSKPTPKSRFKEGKWLESLAKVVAYKEEHGTCNVPRKWKKDPTLGEWVHFQRRQFRLKQLVRRNHMTDDRIRKLEAIGFEWSRGTPNPPNYMRLYSERKEDPTETAVAMPTTEHMMELTPMEMMDCSEQAQQIADVVEQHVTAEQRIQLDHHVVVEVGDKMDHIQNIQTEDIEPLPVDGNMNNIEGGIVNEDEMTLSV